MNIHHVVLSSAALNGINMIGVLYEALSSKLLKYESIKSVYGCSAGALVLALWLTKIKKDDLYNFIINRPWGKAFNPSSNIINDLLTDKGILDIEHINNILSPVFKAQEISPEITLMEFYKYTNVEFHIFSTDSNTFNSVDFSYKTHPDLKLFEAIYMSSSIPFIFKPIYYNDCYMIDGGLSNGFPINPCINDGAKEENILGIRISRTGENLLNKKCNIMSYGLHLINTGVKKILQSNINNTKNQVMLFVPSIISNIDDILNNPDKRRDLLIDGEKACSDFLKSCV